MVPRGGASPLPRARLLVRAALRGQGGDEEAERLVQVLRRDAEQLLEALRGPGESGARSHSLPQPPAHLGHPRSSISPQPLRRSGTEPPPALPPPLPHSAPRTAAPPRPQRDPDGDAPAAVGGAPCPPRTGAPPPHGERRDVAPPRSPPRSPPELPAPAEAELLRDLVDKLSSRDLELQQWERRLAAREQLIQQREEQHQEQAEAGRGRAEAAAARELSLGARERALGARERNLKEQEEVAKEAAAELEERQGALQRRERAAQQREAAAGEAESAVRERERLLQDRERRLRGQQQRLQERIRAQDHGDQEARAAEREQLMQRLRQGEAALSDRRADLRAIEQAVGQQRQRAAAEEDALRLREGRLRKKEEALGAAREAARGRRVRLQRREVAAERLRMEAEELSAEALECIRAVQGQQIFSLGWAEAQLAATEAARRAAAACAEQAARGQLRLLSAEAGCRQQLRRAETGAAEAEGRAASADTALSEAEQRVAELAEESAALRQQLAAAREGSAGQRDRALAAAADILQALGEAETAVAEEPDDISWERMLGRGSPRAPAPGVDPAANSAELAEYKAEHQLLLAEMESLQLQLSAAGIQRDQALQRAAEAQRMHVHLRETAAREREILGAECAELRRRAAAAEERAAEAASAAELDAWDRGRAAAGAQREVLPAMAARVSEAEAEAAAHRASLQEMSLTLEQALEEVAARDIQIAELDAQLAAARAEQAAAEPLPAEPVGAGEPYAGAPASAEPQQEGESLKPLPSALFLQPPLQSASSAPDMSFFCSDLTMPQNLTASTDEREAAAVAADDGLLQPESPAGQGDDAEGSSRGFCGEMSTIASEALALVDRREGDPERRDSPRRHLARPPPLEDAQGEPAGRWQHPLESPPHTPPRAAGECVVSPPPCQAPSPPRPRPETHLQQQQRAAAEAASGRRLGGGEGLPWRQRSPRSPRPGSEGSAGDSEAARADPAAHALPDALGGGPADTLTSESPVEAAAGCTATRPVPTTPVPIVVVQTPTTLGGSLGTRKVEWGAPQGRKAPSRTRPAAGGGGGAVGRVPSERSAASSARSSDTGRGAPPRGSSGRKPQKR
eukprot:TRINITY_DN4240_c0_g1_i1.p1 TRINITY_DN4240_c0_g1~~TRINITY_DN4240_c0_g1_i1.p1  ORF type:complete len:1092 (+),score=300.72 TRINITY_DN4240_c0_g1_i1:70-3345(+)